MVTIAKSPQELQDENDALRGRLAEAEETLRAIRQHEVDAFVMARPGGNQIVTLAGTDYPYRALVESMSEGAVTLIPDGTIFFCNPCFAELVQTPVENLVGTPFLECFAPEERGALAAMLQQAGPVAERAEFRLLSADGALAPMQLSIQRLKPEIMDGISIVIADIRQRKQAEAALAQSHDLLSRAEQIGQFGSWELDLTTRQVAWSEGIYRLLGLQRGSAAPTLQTYLEHVHPDDRAATRQTIETATREHIPLVFENRIVRPDGQVRVLFSRAETTRDGLGQPERQVGIEIDITERKQAELAEREQRVLAEALRDTADALNSTLDLDLLLVRILENVGRVVPHETANILLIEGSRVRITSGHGYSERGTGAAGLGQSFDISAVRNVQIMFETSRPLIIADNRDYPGWIVMPGTEWFRSFAGAPIRVKSKIIGFITLNSGEPGFFTAAHGDRLQAFADQAGSALENARLMAETRQRLGELEAVAQVSAALRSAQTVDTLLPLLIDDTLAILGLPMGAIWLRDPATGELYSAVARGWDGPPPTTRPGESPLGLAFASGQPYLAREYKTDARATASMLAWPDGLGGANIPLRTGTGIIGVLSVGTRLPRVITLSEERLLTTIADIAGTAIHRLQLSEQTERRLQRLSALRAIDLAINSSLDLNVTLQILLDQVTTQLGVDAAVVRLARPHTKILEHAAGRGFRSTSADHPSLRLGQGFAGRAVVERRTLALPDLSLDTPDPTRAAALISQGYHAYYGVPLIAKGMVHGALEIFNRLSLHPDADWLDFLEALAGQAAIAIDNSQLFDDLQSSNLDLSLAYEATIEGWSRALDLRDKETEGHTLRVTEMALRLARAFALTEAELVHFRRGALLHDIGKMGVPDRILLKPGPLTDDEWVIMKLHPAFANEMLSPIRYLRSALDIPYGHHEKWDGTGYPRGLAGAAIPLAARLFAVVDVWDALRSARAYRPAWPEAKVRQHIRALSGTQFDPRVVDVFEALLAADDNDSAGHDTAAAHQPAALAVGAEPTVIRSL